MASRSALIAGLAAACMSACLAPPPERECPQAPSGSFSLAWDSTRTGPDTAFNPPRVFLGSAWSFRGFNRLIGMEGAYCDGSSMRITLTGIADDSLSWGREESYGGPDRTPVGAGFRAAGRHGVLPTPLWNRPVAHSFALGDDRFAFEETAIGGSNGERDTAVFSARYGLLYFKHPESGQAHGGATVMWLETYAGSQVPVDSLLAALKAAMTTPPH